MNKPDYPRVLIIAENASLEYGGEAAIPLHIFRSLTEKGVEVWLLVHERRRDELLTRFPAHSDRFFFIRDTGFHRALWWLSRPLPERLAQISTRLLMRYTTQLLAKRCAGKLVRDMGVEVVHQPIPVSPREPSMIYGLGVPVIIGPMNGAMNYPPAFTHYESVTTRSIVRLGRLISYPVHYLLPGKLRADVLLAANARTAAALPGGSERRVEILPENGVDLSIWREAGNRQVRAASKASGNTVTFVFIGRMIPLKAIDVAIEALARLGPESDTRLIIIGEGPERERLEWLCSQLALDVPGKVEFTGWLSQSDAASLVAAADALLMPSIHECGGAVVLEAMALAKPVVAVDWGGPADYLDSSCGYLVEPESREALVEGFRSAMSELSGAPELRKAMGRAGKRKIEMDYDWRMKAGKLLELYLSVCEGYRNILQID